MVFELDRHRSAEKRFALKASCCVEANMDKQRIVAVALVTQPELELLGPSFTRSFPVDETPCFGKLLRAIDDADREMWRERDAADEQEGR